MRPRATLRTIAALASLPLAAALAGCASDAPAPAPAPGTSEVFGSLRLVPHEGVKPQGHSSSSYGSRRMQGVEFVDYSSPGFAVVFVDGPQPPGGQVELTIRGGRVTRLEPSVAAVGAAGHVSVTNATSEPHVLSYPAAGRMQRLGPGERADFDVAQPGEQGLFLLGVPGAVATVFAAPGPYAVLSSAGRYELTGLAPGPHEIHAWHPRFPPASQAVELAPDARLQVDFAIGVGRGDSESSEGGAEAHAHDH